MQLRRRRSCERPDGHAELPDGPAVVPVGVLEGKCSLNLVSPPNAPDEEVRSKARLATRSCDLQDLFFGM